MKISESKSILKVGDKVCTNGDAQNLKTDFFEGEIGEIQPDSFFVWQNIKEGQKGSLDPISKGYKYSWQIYFSNPNIIDIITNPITNNNMASKALQFIKNSFLPKREKLLKRNGFLNEDGNLTPDYYEAVLDCEARQRGYKSIEAMRKYFNKENNVSILELEELVKKHEEEIAKNLEEFEAEEKEKK